MAAGETGDMSAAWSLPQGRHSPQRSTRTLKAGRRTFSACNPSKGSHLRGQACQLSGVGSSLRLQQPPQLAGPAAALALLRAAAAPARRHQRQAAPLRLLRLRQLGLARRKHSLKPGNCRAETGGREAWAQPAFLDSSSAAPPPASRSCFSTPRPLPPCRPDPPTPSPPASIPPAHRWTRWPPASAAPPPAAPPPAPAGPAHPPGQPACQPALCTASQPAKGVSVGSCVASPFADMQTGNTNGESEKPAAKGASQQRGAGRSVERRSGEAASSLKRPAAGRQRSAEKERGTAARQRGRLRFGGARASTQGPTHRAVAPPCPRRTCPGHPAARRGPLPPAAAPPDQPPAGRCPARPRRRRPPPPPPAAAWMPPHPPPAAAPGCAARRPRPPPGAAAGGLREREREGERVFVCVDCVATKHGKEEVSWAEGEAGRGWQQPH